MFKHPLMIVGLLAALHTGCGGRPVDSGETWEERVLAACEKNCAVAVCNPHNLYFEQEAMCLDACVGSDQVAEQNACSEAVLGFTECLGSLSCDEATANSAAIQAGENPLYCQAEVELFGSNCPGETQ